MGPLIEKTFEASIKDVDLKKGIVEGYFNTWDIVDSDGDELIRGAFLKSLQERGPGSARPRIMHLWMHDARYPLARFTEPGSLVEDKRGLKFVSQVSKTTVGRDVLQLYADGVINEHSIGFQTVKNEAADEGHNRITEVKLWEGSTVTWGANMDTPVTDLKSLDAKDMAKNMTERIEILTKSIKNGGYSDDTFVLLELHLQQIKAHYESLISQISAGATTDDGDEPTTKITVPITLF